MQTPQAEAALVEWARDNNVKDLLPTLTEHGFLTLESVSHIDKKTVVELGIRKPGDGMRLQLAVLKLHIFSKRPQRPRETAVNNFWSCRFCEQINPQSVYNCVLCLSPKPESTEESDPFYESTEINIGISVMGGEEVTETEDKEQPTETKNETKEGEGAQEKDTKSAAESEVATEDKGGVENPSAETKTEQSEEPKKVEEPAPTSPSTAEEPKKVEEEAAPSPTPQPKEEEEVAPKVEEATPSASTTSEEPKKDEPTAVVETHKEETPAAEPKVKETTPSAPTTSEEPKKDESDATKVEGEGATTAN